MGAVRVMGAPTLRLRIPTHHTAPHCVAAQQQEDSKAMNVTRYLNRAIIVLFALSIGTGGTARAMRVPNAPVTSRTTNIPPGAMRASLVTPATVATLAVNPASGIPGGTVTVSGGGFGANETVVLAYDGSPTYRIQVQATAAGQVPETAFIIPAISGSGAHRIVATGATSGVTATAGVTVSPATLAVNPASGIPGGTVTVSGGGFGANEAVTIMLNGVATPITKTQANSAGALTGAAVTIPITATAGIHPLTATGTTSGQTATATLNIGQVNATVAVAPSATTPGGLVSISGSNFLAGEGLTISVDGIITPVVTVTATAQGVLPPTSVSIPYAVAAGPHVLRVTGATSGRTATAPITITVTALSPVIVLSASSATPRSTVTVTGRGFGRQERVTLALNGSALTTIPSVITTTDGTFTATFTAPQSLLVSGANTVSAIGNESRVSAIASLTGTLPVASSLYFAGASTLFGERATLPILNSHAQRAHVTLTFYYQTGAPGHASLDVPAHSRGMADLTAMAGVNRTFGIALAADRAVQAQLKVARPGRDGVGLLGVSAPSTTWYLAEGYTGLTFHETLALANPGPTTAQVQLRLLPFGGRPAHTVLITVPAHTERMVDVNHAMPGQSLSVIATSSTPIVVERALTFSNGGFGATAKPGINVPATSWLFAEGTTTTRFQTFLTILNPNTMATQVTASFYGRAGDTLGSRTILVPGLSRANIKLNDFLHASGIASVVTANAPIVVERPEYFGSPNAPGVAGSDVFGRNGAGIAWSFPGGTTSNSGLVSARRREFLLIYNPSARTVVVDATFYGSDGAVMTRRIVIPPRVRHNVDVNRLVPGVTAQHGITLRGVNGVGFVAEQTIFAPDYSSLTSSQGVAQ